MEAMEEQLVVKSPEDIKIEGDEIEKIDVNCKQEMVTEEEKNLEENDEEQQQKIKEENLVDEQQPSVLEAPQELQIEENTNKTMFDDLEIPDTMEIIQVTEVLPLEIIEEPVVEDIKLSSSPITDQEIVNDEIKPKSPSPVPTMTCSIDGNNDTEGIVPVAAQTMGTIKINISQKSTPVIAKPIVPPEDSSSSFEPLLSQDFTQTFGEYDPDQPPPPGLEMETVVATKVQKEMKPRLMQNAKKIKEYPMVNKGKEMSGLCSIM